MIYSQIWWSILWICALHLPIQVHTHSSEHAYREHTPRAVGSHLCCSAWGAVGGSVPCSRAPRRGIEGGERVLYIHSPPTIPAGPRFKLATFWLWVRLSTIRPWLPTWLPKKCNGIGQYVLCELSHIKCECFYIILTETGLLDNFLIASWAVVSNSIPGGPELCEFSSNQLQITPGWKFLVILKTLKAGPGVFE